MSVGPEQVVKELLQLKGWQDLYPTQQRAIEEGLLDSKRNFVVVAPTASGKTGVAELAMLQTLKEGMRVVYLVPMMSLISDKVREFHYLEGNYKVIEGKSALRDWDEADVVITTFELFYRTALTARSHVEGFSLAVIDEFHVLYDKLRGFNLEKVITVLREFDIRIICLSATFEDKNEVGEWLNAKVVEVPREFRAVPLKHSIIDLSDKPPSKQNLALNDFLLEESLRPCIIFCSTRESTKNRALGICEQIKETYMDENKLMEEFEGILGRERQHFTDLEKDLCKCLCKRVAFHHSGLDPRLKTFIEEKFIKGNIDFLFATTGLAYGINFPAKTVVLCDLRLYDPNIRSQVYIPVYMYLQMAGRAGRPQFGNEGYAYIVAKRKDELLKAAQYIEGKIERAFSHIAHDDYFRKAILELVYSGRATDSQILNFFEKTFYNFQSQRVKKGFVQFNLFETIGNHVKYLCDAGFLTYLGAAGYKLTDLGQVTLDFLFGTFASYELAPFLQLNRILDDEKKGLYNFDIIYYLSLLFEGARLTKIPRKTSNKIKEFFENIGVTDPSHAEYSSYAIFFGWIENMELDRIEREYKVYSSQLPQVASELYRLLQVYEALAKRKNFIVPSEFNILKERIRFGVRIDELPFVKLKGIGRDTARNIRRYCRTVLARPPFNYRGSPLDILKALYKDQGEDRFLEIHVKYISGVGEKRAQRILKFIKSSLET